MKEGDFAKIEYSGRNAAGELIETTSRQDAEKAGVFSEKAKYKPFLVVVGKGQLIKGLDEALLNAEEGEEKSIKIPKEKAFGNRKEELVRLVPLEQFKKQDIHPYPGLVLELDGMRARVQSVSGGRVRVDFNHEYAGQELSYTFKVLKKFVSPEEKLNALAEEYLQTTASLKDGIAKAVLGENIKKDSPEYFIEKSKFVSWLQQYVPEVKKIIVEEEYAGGAAKEESDAVELKAPEETVAEPAKPAGVSAP